MAQLWNESKVSVEKNNEGYRKLTLHLLFMVLQIKVPEEPLVFHGFKRRTIFVVATNSDNIKAT